MTEPPNLRGPEICRECHWYKPAISSGHVCTEGKCLLYNFKVDEENTCDIYISEEKIKDFSFAEVIYRK